MPYDATARLLVITFALLAATACAGAHGTGAGAPRGDLATGPDGDAARRSDHGERPDASAGPDAGDAPENGADAPGETATARDTDAGGDTGPTRDAGWDAELPPDAGHDDVGDPPGDTAGPDAGGPDALPPEEGDILSDGRFNYASALQKAIFFYEAQRSGVLPADNRVSWRGDSALLDGADEGVDLTGGWYDAGDHVKFAFPMAASVTLLAWSVVEYRDGYARAGQLDAILDSLRWGTAWLVKAHTGPTELWGQVGRGDADHAFWGSAEVLPMERPSFRIDASCPGSDLAGEAAAALAAASLAFASSEPDWATELRAHAVALYVFADMHRGRYSDCIEDVQPFYSSWSGYEDELAWAALWLYRATGDADYLATGRRRFAALGADTNWTQSWDEKRPGCAVLLARLTGDAEAARRTEAWLDYWTIGRAGQRVGYTPGGLAWLDRWGPLRYAANTAFLAFLYADHLAATDGDTELVRRYTLFAEFQIDYMLGANPAGRSYVVGFGVDPPRNPHHRTAHGSWANRIDLPETNRHVLYGALVGGPDEEDRYVDDRRDYVRNEVALDYNAGFTGALARLVQTYGGTPTRAFPPPERPEGELLVTARLASASPHHVELALGIHNHTAWPARVTDDLAVRVFVDLGEVLVAGYTPTDVSVAAPFGEVTTVSALQPFDAARALYFVELSLAGVPLAPRGESESRREVQIRLSLPGDGPGAWDPANDWSFAGLATDAARPTDRIVVYEAGRLAAGREPE